MDLRQLGELCMLSQVDINPEISKIPPTSSTSSTQPTSFLEHSASINQSNVAVHQNLRDFLDDEVQPQNNSAQLDETQVLLHELEETEQQALLEECGIHGEGDNNDVVPQVIQRVKRLIQEAAQEYKRLVPYGKNKMLEISEDEWDEYKDHDEEQGDFEDSDYHPRSSAVKKKQSKKRQNKQAPCGSTKCEICEHVAPNRGELTKHMRKHVEIPPYGCTVEGCTYRSRYPNNVDKHLRAVHSDDRPFTCNSCEKSFKRLSSLQSHALTHVDAKPIACDLCPFTCKRNWELTSHKRYVHGPKLTSLKCTFCNLTFKVNSDRLKHERRVHYNTERNKECPVCSKKFKNETDLRKHVNSIHATDPRELTCPICELQLKGKLGLRKHIEAVHLKQRKFCCEVCGNTFACEGNLRTHMRVHDPTRPLACPHCTFKFLDEVSLRAHVGWLHKGSKINYCEYCQRNFRKKSQYDQHLYTEKHARNTQIYTLPRETEMKNEATAKKQANLLEKATPSNNETIAMLQAQSTEKIHIQQMIKKEIEMEETQEFNVVQQEKEEYPKAKRNPNRKKGSKVKTKVIKEPPSTKNSSKVKNKVIKEPPSTKKSSKVKNKVIKEPPSTKKSSKVKNKVIKEPPSAKTNSKVKNKVIEERPSSKRKNKRTLPVSELSDTIVYSSVTKKQRRDHSPNS